MECSYSEQKCCRSLTDERAQQTEHQPSWPSRNLCDSGETLYDGFHYLWSGRTDSKHYTGVGLAMNTKLKKALTSWRAISPRLLSVRFLHQSGHMSVIMCYAPTETSDDAATDQFHDDISVAVNHTSRHDVTIAMGDLNASIGSDRIAHRGIIGPLCFGFANDNRSRLLDFCASDLRIGSSWFPRKRIHQLTWYSNDGVTRKVLDHAIISRHWFSCMTSCRVFRSAELGSSDHRLLAFPLRLYTKVCKQTTPTKRYNTDALNNQAIASK